MIRLWYTHLIAVSLCRDTIHFSHRLLHTFIAVGLLPPERSDLVPGFPAEDAEFDKLSLEAREHGMTIEVSRLSPCESRLPDD
jgi:hypothetical protein